jgi:hypothetical protein
MPDKWIKRWKVPSHSSDKVYTVAQDATGEYGCSCPVWKFKRQECKHIKEVKDGAYASIDAPPAKEPEIVLANVREVCEADDGDGRLLVPLMPLDDTHFQATLIYDLLRHGVNWGTCKERYGLAKRNSKKAIIAYVEERGRRIYGPWQEGRGYVGYSTVPCNR